MYLQKVLYGLAHSQIAYPVGKDKCSYNLNASFTQNVETNEITVENYVTKGLFLTRKDAIFVGTAKECQEYIIKLVEEEGEWVRNMKTLNYEHSQYK